MVKGISRQVIVVRPPDKELFDQAIFILKDRGGESDVTDEMILQQANQAAENYLRTRAKGGRRTRRRIQPVLYILFGALVASVIWALSYIIF